MLVAIFICQAQLHMMMATRFKCRGDPTGNPTHPASTEQLMLLPTSSDSTEIEHLLPPHLPPIHICPADIGAVADGWKVGVFQIPFGDNTSVERLFWANKFQHDPWDISICQHHHHHHGHDHPRPRPPIQASSAAVPCEGHLPSQLLNATFHRHHHYHN